MLPSTLLLLTAASSARLVLGGPMTFNVIGARRHPMHRRGGILSRAPGPSSFENFDDVTYTTEITLGGSNEIYTIELDTGSSDFWVTPSEGEEAVANSKDTGKRAEIHYQDESVMGPIKTAELSFSGYTMPSQSFIEVPEDDGHPTGNGVIGLNIDKRANVLYALKSDVGFSPLHRIFLQDKGLPHIFTILLGRSVDPTGSFPGQFTVGSTLKGQEDIKNQPKLKISGGRHFKFLLEEDSFSDIDGKTIPVDDTVVASTANKKQLTAFVDSGSSVSQVPPRVAGEFYGPYLGAELVNLGGMGDMWIVPCVREVSLKIKIGGKDIYIHPLDATLGTEQLGLMDLKNDKGQEMCVGSFQPFTFKPTQKLDVLFGMPFLRNVYALTDFGTNFFADANSDGYTQLKGTTDPKKAHKDFETVRCNGKPCPD